MTVQPLDDREMAAWHALLRAHSTVFRTLESELEAEHGISLPGYELLAHLSEMPERRGRMSELSRHCYLSASGVTRLVDKLERRGLVRRERCTADARVVYAVLTDEGLALLRRAYPTHLRGVRQHVLDRLATDDVAAVTATMGKLAG